LLSSLAGYPLPLPQMPDSWALVALAGLLVGFGSRLGGGCTSGHGVCGLARFSPRSLAATMIFMLTAVVDEGEPRSLPPMASASPKMPLMPAMRPVSSISSTEARPINAPPTRAEIGSKDAMPQA
jgi:Sulphur transport